MNITDFTTGGNFGIWRRWKMTTSRERTKVVAYIRVVLQVEEKSAVKSELRKMARVCYPRGEVTISEEPCGGEYAQFAVIHVNISGAQMVRIEEIRKEVEAVMDEVLGESVLA